MHFLFFCIVVLAIRVYSQHNRSAISPSLILADVAQIRGGGGSECSLGAQLLSYLRGDKDLTLRAYTIKETELYCRNMFNK
jgi:hypothetical protein